MQDTLERAQRAVLQGLHRAHRFAHDPGGLRGVSPEEAKDQDLLLLVGQGAQCCRRSSLESCSTASSTGSAETGMVADSSGTSVALPWRGSGRWLALCAIR